MSFKRFQTCKLSVAFVIITRMMLHMCRVLYIIRTVKSNQDKDDQIID